MNPAAAFQKAALATMATQYQPVVQDTLGQLAQTNRELVQQRRADEFRRWGPEIELEMQRITDPRIATVQNLGLIVDMVASRHRDELVREEVEKRLAERLPANVRMGDLRPDTSFGGMGTSATPTGLLNFNELPGELRTVLEATRMTDAVFAEFLRTYYGPNVDLQAKAAEWLTKAKESRSGIVTNFQMRGSGGRPGYQIERSSSRT